MYHPTSRLLMVLELLHARSALSGPEIAERLEVDGRTVRRYITILQELGVPIESERGRYGRYRLHKGWLPRLPATVADTAVALSLSLAATRRYGMALGVAHRQYCVPAAASGSMPALPAGPLDIDVMSMPGKDMRLLFAAFQPDRPTEAAATLRYRAYHGDELSVPVEPAEGGTTGLRYRAYHGDELNAASAVFCLGDGWYCLTREAGEAPLLHPMRPFITAELQPPSPAEDAARASVRQLHSLLERTPGALPVRVVLEATRDEVVRRMPRTLATLTEVADGVLLQCSTDDVGWLACFLLGLGCTMRVEHPRALHEQIAAITLRALPKQPPISLPL